jgi:hypothetical protein
MVCKRIVSERMAELQNEGNQSLSFGHQVTFKPNDKITLNSSSFIGNDKPQDDKRMRYFHDLYGSFQLTDHFQLY